MVRRQVRRRRARRRMVRRTARQAGLLAGRFGARRTNLQNRCSAQPGSTPDVHRWFGDTPSGAENLAELAFCPQKPFFLFFSLF